jgi:MFS family permease
VLASPEDVESTSRLGLLRRSPSFGFLFLATAGSSFGTYLAAIALTVDVYDRTGSGVWVAALLIADFLPIVLIGLLLGPLVDRLSRRRLIIVSDLARFGVFAALPFVDSAGSVVGLAAVSGVATGFFQPAVYAGLPNLVPDEELTNANSLLQTVETLAWMIGPVVGGLMLTAWGPSVPYAVNAVTFLVSAALVARILESKLRSEESLSRGHWRDVADGVRLVLTARPLRTVLVVWNVVLVGAAAVNVAEVIFARETLGAGNVGFGAIVAASGVGLAFGSFLAAPALGKVGLRRHYVGSIALMALGWGGAALSGTIWLVVPFVIGGSAGNGAAIICNRLLVQRGAPDQYRGRALATIMSTNYAVLGLAMAAAGVVTDAFGARAVWIAAGSIYLVGALVALVMTRWLPVVTAEEQEAIETSTESALAALAQPHALEPSAAPRSAATSGLERIASLLEEVERRRELEARRLPESAIGPSARPRRVTPWPGGSGRSRS